ncbi:MAG: SDR family NAD(P)-dependent oxidoreductase, partial [Clostridia bacterium]|nr:SDR family NAD(P)-dependent oxidoreductase [Clostridia bacterium]
EIAKEINERFGPCKFLVNGAGGNNGKVMTTNKCFEQGELELDNSTEFKGFFNIDMNAFEDVLKINTIGSVIPSRIFGRQMAQNGGGSIINFASMNSYCPLTKVPAYAMSKSAVVMCLHPDDPPIPLLLGYSRIVISADAYRRILSMSDSPSHKITFCQSCFSLMGCDVFELIKEFGNRIEFLHFRDVEGERYNFKETFHDNGPTDMVKLMKYAAKYAPDCVVRADHTPSMAGEDNSNLGYAVLGNLFAAGYIRGIAETLNIKFD